MTRAVEDLLLRAAREVQLLAAATPENAAAERARLADALRRGGAECPRWTYRNDAQGRRMGDLRQALEALGTSEGVDEVVAERARELAVEAALCEAVGTRALGNLAEQRFGHATRDVKEEASRTCAAWLQEPREVAPGETMASDDPDPRSLVSRLRAEVGRLRLPFAVVVQPSLAPLAATGDRVVLVAPGRPTTERDVARTVLHEIEGHVLPRARAQQASLVILRVGTARGVDDQEGRALLLEERAGLLCARRRRHLAMRHRAVQAMVGGASFADVTRELTSVHGLDPAGAVVVAERVFRGGDGVHPGLGRERVYLESLVRVRAHLGAHPEDEPVLASGQVGIDAVAAIRPALSLGEADVR
ncbi:MAG TPA: tyrosine/phenylalanine carboxypeptidase domain-containing protein [Polyangiaceae bacterium]